MSGWWKTAKKGVPRGVYLTPPMARQFAAHQRPGLD
jgi:hypothetical protein